MKKRDYQNILLLELIGILVIIGIFVCGNVFGANMDFINQHSVIPEYFRQYFYQNKKLIPDIIYNLGLGQNAFNFSYYGLFSPIILVSYLLPHITMSNYIIISSIVLYLLTIYLFYRWIRNSFDYKFSFLLTSIFITASPVLFHFHRQIMFVSYLPFLLLSLINIDNFDKNKHKILLCINIFLMIMTSYYFSVGGIIIIIIYFLYKNYYKSFKEKIMVLIPILIAVLSSGILIVPTLSSLLSNRVNGSDINLLSLLIPMFNYDKVLYGSYSLGLFSIAVISIYITFKFEEKNYKFLSICLIVLITFPIFRYILNGGLYIRSKVLIPFLPLFVLSIGIFLTKLFTNKINYKTLFITILILSILGLYKFNLVYYIDLLVTTIIIFIYKKYNKKQLIFIPLIILSLINIIVSNYNEDYVTIDEYKNLTNYEDINKVLDSDPDIYRFSNIDNTLYNVNRSWSNNYYKTSLYSSTTNIYYQNFYYDVLKINNNNYNNLIIRDSSNIIFNRLIGVKYIYSSDELGLGYEKITDNIYLNNYALPIGYASSNIYSLAKFNNLGYPYNLKYLLNGIVIDNNSNVDTDDIIKEYKFDIISELGKYLAINKHDKYYDFSLKEDINVKIKLPEILEDKLLLINIDGLEENDCSIGDIGISINDIENTLNCSTWLYNNHNNSFNYLINDKDLGELNINIKKGNYKITDIKLYTMDINNLNSNFDLMTDININDNILTGNIDMTRDGYMTISVPYDDNFTVYVDDVKTDYEQVNTAFIGFKLSQGSHKIRLEYHAKGLLLGKVFSIIGISLLILYLIYLRYKNKGR